MTRHAHGHLEDAANHPHTHLAVEVPRQRLDITIDDGHSHDHDQEPGQGIGEEGILEGIEDEDLLHLTQTLIDRRGVLISSRTAPLVTTVG